MNAFANLKSYSFTCFVGLRVILVIYTYRDGFSWVEQIFFEDDCYLHVSMD